MPGAKEDGGRERRNRSDEVLSAAIDLFHRKGYASASIQDVADAVGVLKGSLYHYIDSKEDLLARIFDESDRQSHEIMDRVAAMEVSAVERLHAFAESWALWYMKNVERTSLYFNEWRHLTGERLDYVIEQRHGYERYVADLIEAAKAEGAGDRALDTRYASFFILSAINGLPTWYRRRGSDSAEHIAAVYADMVVGMVQGTEARSKPPRRPAKAKGKAKAKSKAKGKAKAGGASRR
jgi:AcrR family transcriptional regulator